MAAGRDCDPGKDAAPSNGCPVSLPGELIGCTDVVPESSGWLPGTHNIYHDYAQAVPC